VLPGAEALNDGVVPRLHRFMGVMLEHAPGVLAPRQETELLGRSALAILRDRDPDVVVIDMCCGSGNLALAIATELPSAHVWCADLTDDAVALAQSNAARLRLQDRVIVRQGDLFGAFDADALEAAADMIVCNPPYISSARLEGESAYLVEAEPREAFDGGPYGIAIHQRLIRDAARFLKPDGWLLFEFGEGQDRQVAALAARAKFYGPVTFARNEAGAPRVAMLRKVVEIAPSAVPT
jgi:release factor glutamine methyltransferase